MNSNNQYPRVYLAGPDVFFPDCKRIFQALKAHCDDLGLAGIAPTDCDLPPGLSGDPLAQRIYEGNIDLIRGADGVIANLMDFRGLEPDSGTVFEVGYAIALGKPVVAYDVPAGDYATRVAQAIPCEQGQDGVTREVKNGLVVEGMGQKLNLMLSRSCVVEPTAAAALVRMAELLRASRQERPVLKLVR